MRKRLCYKCKYIFAMPAMPSTAVAKPARLFGHAITIPNIAIPNTNPNITIPNTNPILNVTQTPIPSGPPRS